MNVELGLLGQVVMNKLIEPIHMGNMVITHDGFTEYGIRVHVIEENQHMPSNFCWNNALVINGGLK